MPHIHENIDFTVEVFIVYKDRVLLRMHDKYKIWLSVGGHIELDEDPVQAALREVKEEVGLDVELIGTVRRFNDEGATYHELLPPRFMNRHRINPTHEHVSLIYFARATNENLVLSDTEITDGCKWFTKEELEQATDVRDSIRQYAIAALRAISIESDSSNMQ